MFPAAAHRLLIRLFATAVLLTAFTVSGCGPSWVIVRQANPNPLAGQTNLSVDGMHYETMTVGGKPEGIYLADKDQNQRDSFLNDKNETAKVFFTTLRAEAKGLVLSDAAPGAVFVVQPTVTFWEPGYYAYVARQNSIMNLVLRILDGQGQVIDEVNLTTQVEATLFNPSTGGRMGSAARQLAEEVARYLRFRTAAPGR